MAQREVELTRLDEASLREFREAFADVFGIGSSEAGLDRARRTAEYDRFIAARSAGRVVGTCGAYSFDMAMPWSPPAGCAGISAVSVRADHRRRGLLTRMMGELLDDAQERGEPFAALWASEGPIYGRYGFGPAIPTAAVRIERAHARFRVEADPDSVALIDAEEAARRFPAVHDAVRRQRHGTLSRNAAWWGRELADPAQERDGAGAKRYAVVDDRGYAIHRLRPSWGEEGVPQGTVEVQELLATDADAYRALWRFVIDTDLASTVTAGNIPVDDPIGVLLDDPVRTRTSFGWPLYVRLVDVPTALMARGYRVDDVLNLRVHDGFRPGNDGVWRLAVVDGVASCESTPDAAEVELDVSALATVSVGGVRVASLAAAGLLAATSSAAVKRFERLLATDVAPWHGSMF